MPARGLVSLEVFRELTGRRKKSKKRTARLRLLLNRLRRKSSSILV
jgi:hypothetical protein